MAGGRFDKLVGKVRPGVYVNFESKGTESVEKGSRGTVIIPLTAHDYGPLKEIISVSSGDLSKTLYILGHSIYDNEMLMIREALKCAQTVLVYIAASGGQKATAGGGGVTATAKYAGSRGNKLKYSIASNPIKGFDVSVFLSDKLVSLYEGVSTLDELKAKNDMYIDFSGDGELEAVAGVNLESGENAITSNKDVTDFLDAAEGQNFNTMAFPLSDESLISACKNKIEYLRETVGKEVQAVVADYENADYEGIINVTNSVRIGSIELTHAQATAWVAGATAAAENTTSNTYKVYEGATGIVDPKTHEGAIAAIKAGEFFFTNSEKGDVVVEYDINSLVTYTEKKNVSYRKNRVIRVLDSFSEALQLNFPPNKFDNDADGWNAMLSVGKSILKEFEDAGAITDVDYDNDFLIDENTSIGDATYFDVGLQPVDSSEKLYFTVVTR